MSEVEVTSANSRLGMERISDVSGVALLNSSDDGRETPPAADAFSASLEQMVQVQKQLESFLKASKLARGRSECEAADDFKTESHSETSDEDTEHLLAEKLSPVQRSVLPISSSSNAFLTGLIGLSPESINAHSLACEDTMQSTSPRLEKSEHRILCESLDRERLRRKICEQKIQDLQKNMLQLQQQLTVTASTNKKREFMIEQLEKTLRGIISGWQQQQHERLDIIKKLQREKQLLEEACSRHRDAYSAVELQLDEKSRVLDETIRLRDQQLKQQTEERTKSLGLLSREQGKVKLLEEEKVSLLAANGDLTSEIDQEHSVCEHLREELNRLETEHKDLLQTEREKNERENRLLRQYKEMASSLQLEVQRLTNTTEQLKTEKEGLEVKLQLKESEHRASLMQLRAELQAAWETELMTKLTEAQDEAEKWQEEMNRQYRSEIADLRHRHNSEIMSWKQQIEKECEERHTNLQHSLDESEDRVKLLGGQLECEIRARREAESRSDDASIQLKALVQSHCEQAIAIIESIAAKEGSPVEDRSDYSSPTLSNDHHLQLSHAGGSPSLSTHDTLRKLSHMDGSPLIQLSEHYPNRSAQSLPHLSPPVKQVTSHTEANQVSFEGQSTQSEHVTSLSWLRQRQTPVVSLVTRDSKQEISSPQLTRPSATATNTYNTNTSVSASQLDSFEEKLQFHEKQQDELRQYVRMLLNRIPSQPLMESNNGSALPPLSLSSLHQQPTSPLFSPIQSKSTISLLSTPAHQADSSTAEQVQTQTNSFMRQQSSYEHTGSSSAMLQTGQSDITSSERLKAGKQSQTGSKARKLGNQYKPHDTVRRNLQGSFQEEKVSTTAMSKPDQWFPRDKQPSVTTLAKARSQSKPWK